MLKSVRIIWNRHEMIFFFTLLWDMSHMLEFIHERLIHTKWMKKGKRNGRRRKRHGNLFSAQHIRVHREHWQRSETRSIIFSHPSPKCTQNACLSFICLIWLKYQVKYQGRTMSTMWMNVSRMKYGNYEKIYVLHRHSDTKSFRSEETSFLIHFLFFAPWFILLLF